MSTLLQNRFAYQARDPQGQMVSGLVSAITLTDASKALRAEGKFILDLKPAGADTGANTADGTPQGSARGRVARDEVILFTIQLSVMVDTGVPLSDALIALSEQSYSPNFTAVIKQLLGDVQGGKDFSTCLEACPRVFPTYYVSLVRASEMSGTMGAILKRLADYLVGQRDIVKKVRGAMIYPAFMFFMCIAVTVFLLTAVLPRFTAIFAARQAALPMPTQILIMLSGALIGYWYLWVGGTLLIAFTSYWYTHTATGRRRLDFLKLHIPILSGLFNKLYLARSLHTIGTMIQSGVKVMDCLTIVREVVGNAAYAELWDEVRDKIQQGQQLSEPLLRSPLIPRSVSQMIHSAEKTGELPAVLARVAAYLEDDLRASIKTTTQFIEPLMIGIMGILIGGIAIAMLLPILTISRVMAQ
ncbi:MAG: type II secretion system F family protein [Phycisphaerae bacterium]